MKDAKTGLGGTLLRAIELISQLKSWPVIGPCVRWAGKKLLPRETRVWVQVQDGPGRGIWLHLNPRTGRGYYEGTIEVEVQRVMADCLRPGMTFYDAGANLGFFALLASRLVGPTGAVVAFEADPENAARLRENKERNEYANLKVVENAVWSETGTVVFARSDPSFSPDRGLGHVASADADTDCINVPAISLDDYARDFPPPEFIKCDVEGAEIEVFLGAQRLLREKRPVFLCEMHSEANRQRLELEFSRLGYVSLPCGGSHVLLRPV